MPSWLKYVLSISSGFAATALTSIGSGTSVKHSVIAGSLAAVVALGNLQATSPADHAALGRN